MTPLARRLLAALLLVLWTPYARADLFFVTDSSAATLDAVSTLHIEFADGFAITYEVTYDSSVTLTGQDLFDLVAVETAADLALPDFSYAATTFSFGVLVDTISVDEIDGTPHSETPIFADTGTFWSYWVTDPAATPLPWDTPTTGISERLLADGSFDGWIVGDGVTMPGLPANVPEPASLALAAAALLVGAAYRRRCPAS